MSRRGTTPSLEASQQTHIDDLVQRNRTLDHTIRKLKDELAQEKSRAKNAIHDIQQRWHAEQREWREGCDTLQSCHRIAHLRTVVELEKVRLAVLNEQDALRREKAAALQREFMITKFQVTEGELERRIEDLEDELEELGASREEERRTLSGEVKELASHLKLQEEQLAAAEQENEVLQTELKGLHKSVAEQQVLSESTAAKLERASLQLEGERGKKVDLQRANDEFRHTIDDLKRQLDKWQSLETKGGAEVETLRKRRVELEVEVQALRSQLAKREEEEGKAVEAERSKRQKLKQTLDQWMNHSKSVQTEFDDAKKQLGKVEREMKKLKRELDLERTKTRASASQKQNPILSEDEVVHEMSRAASPNSPPIASGSRRKASKPASQQASRRNRKAPDVVADAPTEDEVQEVSEVRNKGKGKTKATESDVESAPKATRRRGNVVTESTVTGGSDTEIEEVPREAMGAPATKRRATKKNPADSEDESQAKGKRRRKVSPMPVAGDEVGEEFSEVPTKRKKQNTNGSGKRGDVVPPSGVESTASTVTTDADAGKAKKKRKINLFANTASALPANLFGSQNDALGLNIPTVLSPLKTDAVPRASASVLSRTIGRR